MQRSLSILPLLSVLLTTVACPDPGSDEGGQDTSDTETGDGDDGDGDGDGDDDGEPEEDLCAAGCFRQFDCGLLSTPDEIDVCYEACETEVAAWQYGFGDECGKAQEVFSHCLLTEECVDPDFYFEYCVDVEPFGDCIETVIPELDQLCDCVAAQDPFPNAKALCMMDMTDWVLIGYADGLECIGEVTTGFGCMAATCEDPGCDWDDPTTCLCSESEQAILAACPSFSGE